MAGRDPLMQGVPCDRAREWASLRLDDELSLLEEELLARHLELCEECRAFESDVRWASDVIRLTPQERPAQRLTMPAAPKPRVTARRVTAIAATAALALGALMGAVLDSPSSTAPSDEPDLTLLTNQRDADEFRQLPRTRILSPAPLPSTPPNTPEGVV